MLTQLDVVNECTAMLGEAPVTTVDNSHPFHLAALRKLAMAEVQVQSTWYWWNTRQITLTPDENGLVTLPDHAVEFYTRYGTRAYFVQIELNDADEEVQVLYDVETKLPATQPVCGTVVFNYPLGDVRVPAVAQMHIKCMAVRLFQGEFDADGPKKQTIAEDLRYAAMQHEAMNTRITRVNLLNRPTTAWARARIRGLRPVVGR